MMPRNGNPPNGSRKSRPRLVTTQETKPEADRTAIEPSPVSGSRPKEEASTAPYPSLSERDGEILNPPEDEKEARQKVLTEAFQKASMKGFREGFSAAREMAARAIDREAQKWADGIGRPLSPEEAALLQMLLIMGVHVRSIQVPEAAR